MTRPNHALGCEVAAALAPLELGQRGFCVLAAAPGAGSEVGQAPGVEPLYSEAA